MAMELNSHLLRRFGTVVVKDVSVSCAGFAIGTEESARFGTENQMRILRRS